MDVPAKLQIKPGHSVAVLHRPPELDVDLGERAGAPTDPVDADAVIVFATNRAELEARAEPAVEADRRDALAWVVYPKAGKLGTDLNRESLNELLGARGARPVRQIAVDGTWSAMRFRPA